MEILIAGSMRLYSLTYPCLTPTAGWVLAWTKPQEQHILQRPYMFWEIAPLQGHVSLVQEKLDARKYPTYIMVILLTGILGLVAQVVVQG